MIEGGSEPQNWRAASIIAATGVLLNIAQWLFHRGRSEEPSEAYNKLEERLDQFHDDLARQRRDYERFKEDLQYWQASVDRKLNSIARSVGTGD